MKKSTSKRIAPGSYTKMESILGENLAKKCQDEIEARIHPKDTPELREHILREIIGRHVKCRNLRIDEIELFADDLGSKSHAQALRNQLACIIYDHLEDEDAVKEQEG